MADKQEKRKEYMKTYRERNCEEMGAQKRLHYEEHRGTILEQRHEYYIGNKDEILKKRNCLLVFGLFAKAYRNTS